LKTINFLTGLPRSGNTLVSSILNQNPMFYSSPLSPVGNFCWSVIETSKYDESYIRNTNNEALNSCIKDLAYGYYSSVNKDIIFDRGKCWTTPANIELLYTINPNAKIIFTVRPLLDILSSFIVQYKDNEILEKRMIKNNFYAINYLSLDDAKCDFLMDSSNDILKNFYSLKNALKQENRKNVFFIEYSNLVKNPKDTFKNLYSFLEQDYFEHDFNNVNKKELDLGYEEIDPKGMHDVRKKVLDTSLNPEDVLSKYVIDKYSGYDFWKGQI
jgi:hypothetical protein